MENTSADRIARGHRMIQREREKREEEERPNKGHRE